MANKKGTMSSQLNQTDIAYIAGLFDGEGCVTYSRRRQKKGTNKKHYMFWDIRCEISMTDKYVIEWLHKTLGIGSFNKRKAHKSWLGKKNQWRWRCSHRDALQFAKLIWPHVQVKLHKIEQILDHYTVDDLDPPRPSAKIIYLKERKKTNVL